MSIRNSPQFGVMVRLVLSSLLMNGTFYALALLELQLGFASWQTVLLNYPLSVAISFVLSRNWIFSKRDRPRSQLIRYVIVYVGVYIGSMLFVAGLEQLGVAPWIALLINLFPAAIALYLGLNLWVFPTSRKADE